MWIYHSSGNGNCHPVYLYEYDNGSRAGYVIGEYLKGYTGVLFTDGYQSYHTLQKEQSDDIKAVDKKKAMTSGQKVAEEAKKG